MQKLGQEIRPFQCWVVDDWQNVFMAFTVLSVLAKEVLMDNKYHGRYDDNHNRMFRVKR